MEKIIRKAKLPQVDELAELFDQYRVFYENPSDIEGARQFLAERMVHEESVVFMSFNNERDLIPTGFVQLYPLFSSTKMKKLWLLNDLFVHSDYRGQGYGIALIEKAKELCRVSRSRGMYLETAKTNAEGNALYPKMGFELDEEHNYYNWEVDGE